ncbi:hypothetical protein RRG08_005731 [Elysia crispata]|uniref:Uncharacterized protein n=1 Tax=Elysia crispata TaxID=231223 RepID=A0AAE0YCK7_9GAST|nr:hypothetical protein RRG08_005731 [Elysia crispata]
MSSRSCRSLHKSGSSNETGRRKSLGRTRLPKTMNYHRNQFNTFQDKNNDGESLRGHVHASKYKQATLNPLVLPYRAGSLLESVRPIRRETPYYYSSRFMMPLPPIGSGSYMHQYNPTRASGSGSPSCGASSNHPKKKKHGYFLDMIQDMRNGECPFVLFVKVFFVKTALV